MFVNPEDRGKGISLKNTERIESWAEEENFKSCILETGKNTGSHCTVQEKRLRHNLKYTDNTKE
jgi:hypothetical protein